MYVTKLQSLTGFYTTFVLPTDSHLLWTYFLTTIERVYKMWDLQSLLVAMLPYDSLKWMKSVQICHFPGRIIEFTALKIGENIS